MIITKRALSRRMMLRGMGASLALPLLDSMVAPLSAAAGPIHRFGVVYVPNGMIMENYLPAKDGPDYEMTPTLSALCGDAAAGRDLISGGVLKALPSISGAGGDRQWERM